VGGLGSVGCVGCVVGVWTFHGREASDWSLGGERLG
jgi:hypothetical protein